MRKTDKERGTLPHIQKLLDAREILKEREGERYRVNQ
jgi:hypothetical protein